MRAGSLKNDRKYGKMEQRNQKSVFRRSAGLYKTDRYLYIYKKKTPIKDLKLASVARQMGTSPLTRSCRSVVNVAQEGCKIRG